MDPRQAPVQVINVLPVFPYAVAPPICISPSVHSVSCVSTRNCTPCSWITTPSGGFDGGSFDSRMVAQVEVVVAGKRKQAPAVSNHPDAVEAVRRNERAAQVFAFKLPEFLQRKVIE